MKYFIVSKNSDNKLTFNSTMIIVTQYTRMLVERKKIRMRIIIGHLVANIQSSIGF